MTSIHSLPRDCLGCVLPYLDLADYARCRRLTKVLRQAVLMAPLQRFSVATSTDRIDKLRQSLFASHITSLHQKDIQYFLDDPHSVFDTSVWAHPIALEFPRLVSLGCSLRMDHETDKLFPVGLKTLDIGIVAKFRIGSENSLPTLFGRIGSLPCLETLSIHFWECAWIDHYSTLVK